MKRKFLRFGYLMGLLVASVALGAEDCQKCATDLSAWNTYNTEVRKCFDKCNRNDGECIAKCRDTVKNPLKQCEDKKLKDCGAGCSTCITNEDANNEYIVTQWSDAQKCNELCQKKLEECNACEKDCTDDCKKAFGSCPDKKQCSKDSDDCLQQCSSSYTTPFVAPDPKDLCATEGFTDCPKDSGTKIDCGGGCLAACKIAGVKIGSPDFMDCAAACKGTDGAIIDCSNSATNQTCSYDPTTKKITCESTMLAKAVAQKKKAKLDAAKKAKAKSDDAKPADTGVQKQPNQ